MFKIICVTDRKLCGDDFFERLKILHENGVDVILREKDIDEREYHSLCRRALEVCPNLTVHTHTGAAAMLGVKKIHLPFGLFKGRDERFERIGVSVHSPDEAAKAGKLGADYASAGHVFATDCKKGLKPRGLDFLKSAVLASDIPLFAIGGVKPENIASVRERGAAGACIMSGFMRCPDIKKYLDEINKNLLKKQGI